MGSINWTTNLYVVSDNLRKIYRDINKFRRDDYEEF